MNEHDISEYGWIEHCALSIAITNNDIKTVKFLLTRGAWPGMSVDERDHNMLMLAADLGHVDIVECLLEDVHVDVHEQLEGAYYDRIKTVGEKTMNIARNRLLARSPVFEFIMKVSKDPDDVRRRIQSGAHKIIALLEARGVCMPSDDESDEDS